MLSIIFSVKLKIFLILRKVLTKKIILDSFLTEYFTHDPEDELD